jgi:hypothetical protein
MRVKSLLAALLFSACTLFAQHGSGMPEPKVATSVQWQADLAFLRTKLEQLHPNAFANVSRAQLDALQNDIQNQLPNLDDPSSALQLQRLVAAIGDGHTSVALPAVAKRGAEMLPLEFYLFEDGMYVVGADKSAESVLGAQVDRIGKLTVPEVIERATPYVSADNQSGVRAILPRLLMFVPLLRMIGATDSNTVSLSLEREGRRFTLDVSPKPINANAMFGPAFPAFTTDWKFAWNEKSPPLFLRHRNAPYGFEFLPNQQALYVWQNASTTMNDLPVTAFADQVFAEAKLKQAKIVIFDARNNLGGSGQHNWPILNALVRITALEPKPALYAIIGRRTFSAGKAMVSDIQKFLPEARLVGEPTAAGPISFGDHLPLILPNSHLPVMISSVRWYDTGPMDKRQSINPAISVQYSLRDWQNGKDAALEAIWKDVAEKSRSQSGSASK